MCPCFSNSSAPSIWPTPWVRWSWRSGYPPRNPQGRSSSVGGKVTQGGGLVRNSWHYQGLNQPANARTLKFWCDLKFNQNSDVHGEFWTRCSWETNNWSFSDTYLPRSSSGMSTFPKESKLSPYNLPLEYAKTQAYLSRSRRFISYFREILPTWTNKTS